MTERVGPPLRRRRARAEELDALTAMNNAAVPHVSPLAPGALAELAAMAEGCWVVERGEAIAAFVVVMAAGQPYGSANYRWFTARYGRFAYIDRVVVAERHRSRGIGRWLYDELVTDAAGWAPVLTCEVNVVPPNPVSHAFHAALGFVEVGRQDTEGGTRTVALLARDLHAGADGPQPATARAPAP